MASKKETTGKHEGLEALYDVHWSYNWADLPPEAEQRTERAFELIVEARDIAYDEPE